MPADFEAPAVLEHERFRLRMLTVDDVVADFDALCSRVDRDGKPQPPFVATVRENLVDLRWHQKEFELRRSFAYTVVAPDESEVLGCVYLYPSGTHDAAHCIAAAGRQNLPEQHSRATAQLAPTPPHVDRSQR